jgi:hypothetical protein
MFNRKKVLVLGDSHSLVFRSIYMQILLPMCKFIVCYVNGATVSGLENPNSKTNAANIFKQTIKDNKEVQNIVFLLGEVDTGFVIWYRAQKYGTSIDEMLKLALENYRKLLMNESLKAKKLIVISAPLPTIKDHTIHGNVANARREVTATIEERTMLTLKFNAQMKQIADELGCHFVDLDKISLNADKKGVKRLLRNWVKTDHHYNSLVYSLLIYRKISKLFRAKGTIKQLHY